MATTALSTLCYIEKDGKYLMMHRVIKENDINKDKWIGVGGHFLEGESPEECLLREVKEETGFDLLTYRFRGIVTFVYGDTTEYMHLFTSDRFRYSSEGKNMDSDMSIDEIMLTRTDCDEGVLEWIEKSEVYNLDIWEGDRIFFELLERRDDFFSLKLVYDGFGALERAQLDGVELIG